MIWIIGVPVLVIWITSGALAYGITLAYFQREFVIIADRHYNSDATLAFITGLLGPVGLAIAYGSSKNS